MQVMNENIAPTLREQMKHHEPIVCYSEKRFFEWHEDDKSVNIRASSGSYGGGAAKCLSVPKNKEKGQNVDELGWSASRSNTNDEQCRRSATDAGQRKL